MVKLAHPRNRLNAAGLLSVQMFLFLSLRGISFRETSTKLDIQNEFFKGGKKEAWVGDDSQRGPNIILLERRRVCCRWETRQPSSSRQR